jgi:hypothetical protein
MLYKILSVSSPAYLPQSFLYEQKYQYIADGSLFSNCYMDTFLLQIQWLLWEKNH